MRNKLFSILIFSAIVPFSSFSQQAVESKAVSPPIPLFQLSAGLVYSNIDISRYLNPVAYRGFHARAITHLGKMFYLSTEYSTFKTHNAATAWKNIHARKFDLNGHVAFGTNNNLTKIFVLGGINKHEWSGTRTHYPDQIQFGNGIPEGTVIKANKWGVNFGCGFSQILYENIGVFGDYRFCFANANNFEKVTILDVMTTFGISYNIPHPSKSKTKKRKTFGIDNKLYKWTTKGGK